MKPEPRIYLLDPKDLPPETIAVTFAKTSRSPGSFQQIAGELTDQKSSEFNEKWVVGYGHSSVAEHAVLHIAVENYSRLAVECLESNRLASFTEKSTRYQTWDINAFHIPRELQDHPLTKDYTSTCAALFKMYEKMIPKIRKVIESENPCSNDESVPAWKRRTQTMTIDVCRFLLPAASLANVGVTINARALEHAISKMLSSPLLEVQQMGSQIKHVAECCVPTLVKYAHKIAYLDQVETAFSSISVTDGNPPADWCRLIQWDTSAESRILCAALYRYNNIDYAQAERWISKARLEQLDSLARELLLNHDRFTTPLRELEHSTFTFEIMVDQGAYYEVKRHRMMTISPQPLTVDLGYAIPKVISSANMENAFQHVMENSTKIYNQIIMEFPSVASYIVPNAFNRRFLVTANLRSLVHFIGLRSAPNAHFSVRRLAQRMAREISNVLPIFGHYLFDNPDESVESIESSFFTNTQMR
jgi:thymidylate synthase ThyX